MNTLELIALTSGKLPRRITPTRSIAQRQFCRFSQVVLFAIAAACIAALPHAEATMFMPLMGATRTLELVSFSATQPNTGAAAAALSGDSLAVKNSQTTEPAEIIAWWADQQVAGYQQLTFPSGHDTTRGLRLPVRASEVDNMLPEGMAIEVQSGETLAVTIAGSNTAGDVENGAFLLSYPRLLGIQPRLIDWSELKQRRTKLVTVYVALAGGAAGYTGAEALNADSDLLLPNRDYALLGAISSAETCTVALVGPDTGNVRIGMPANDAMGMFSTANFFPRLSRAFGEAFIPIINSGNKANTLVSIVQDENNISPNVGLILALLK